MNRTPENPDWDHILPEQPENHKCLWLLKGFVHLLKFNDYQNTIAYDYFTTGKIIAVSKKSGYFRINQKTHRSTLR